MLFQHAAETVAIREAAIFRHLFDALIRVTEQVAGAVEPVVQEHAHRSHANLRSEQVIQIPDTDACGTSCIFGTDLAREIFLEKCHRLFDSAIEFLVGPGFCGELGELVNNESGRFPVIWLAARRYESVEKRFGDIIKVLGIDSRNRKQI